MHNPITLSIFVISNNKHPEQVGTKQIKTMTRNAKLQPTQNAFQVIINSLSHPPYFAGGAIEIKIVNFNGNKPNGYIHWNSQQINGSKYYFGQWGGKKYPTIEQIAQKIDFLRDLMIEEVNSEFVRMVDFPYCHAPEWECSVKYAPLDTFFADGVEPKYAMFK